eukprot:2176672-Amphidinium_carterae.1
MLRHLASHVVDSRSGLSTEAIVKLPFDDDRRGSASCTSSSASGSIAERILHAHTKGWTPKIEIPQSEVSKVQSKSKDVLPTPSETSDS